MTAMRLLLEGLVDYAGLFPPAALSMRDAVANYASYRDGAHRKMLGRFVLPVSRLEEFEREATPVAHGAPWPLSVLAAASDAGAIVEFNKVHSARYYVDTIEAKATTPTEIVALSRAYPAMHVYVEIPVREDPAQLIEAIHAVRLRAKIRTGGVTADAFPSPEEVLRFLKRCAKRHVAFKATAGLHHPMRGSYKLTYAADAPSGEMYGYLNVFLAAALLFHGVKRAELLPLLEERDATAITSNADGISWREHHLTSAQVAQARTKFAGSFGSCSFDEPVNDLAALHLLPDSL